MVPQLERNIDFAGEDLRPTGIPLCLKEDEGERESSTHWVGPLGAGGPGGPGRWVAGG